MSLRDLATRLQAVGDGLTGHATELAGLDPGPRAFGVDAGGLPGELGRALHALAAAALTARGREATAHGGRLLDTASHVDGVAGGYRDVDAAAHTRHAEGES